MKNHRFIKSLLAASFLFAFASVASVGAETVDGFYRRIIDRYGEHGRAIVAILKSSTNKPSIDQDGSLTFGAGEIRFDEPCLEYAVIIPKELDSDLLLRLRVVIDSEDIDTYDRLSFCNDAGDLYVDSIYSFDYTGRNYYEVVFGKAKSKQVRWTIGSVAYGDKTRIALFRKGKNEYNYIAISESFRAVARVADDIDTELYAWEKENDYHKTFSPGLLLEKSLDSGDASMDAFLERTYKKSFTVPFWFSGRNGDKLGSLEEIKAAVRNELRYGDPLSLIDPATIQDWLLYEEPREGICALVLRLVDSGKACDVKTAGGRSPREINPKLTDTVTLVYCARERESDVYYAPLKLSDTIGVSCYHDDIPAFIAYSSTETIARFWSSSPVSGSFTFLAPKPDEDGHTDRFSAVMDGETFVLKKPGSDESGTLTLVARKK